MKVAVFGAIGRVGALVVQALLDRGHEAVTVSRSTPSKQYGVRYGSLTGDMTDPALIESAMIECDGLIFCVGQRLKSPNNLFSKNLSPADIRTQILGPIMRVIGSDHTKRVVYLSAFGVGTDLRKHALLFPHGAPSQQPRAILRGPQSGRRNSPGVPNQLDHRAPACIG